MYKRQKSVKPTNARTSIKHYGTRQHIRKSCLIYLKSGAFRSFAVLNIDNCFLAVAQIEQITYIAKQIDSRKHNNSDCRIINIFHPVKRGLIIKTIGFAASFKRRGKFLYYSIAVSDKPDCSYRLNFKHKYHLRYYTIYP